MSPQKEKIPILKPVLRQTQALRRTPGSKDIANPQVNSSNVVAV
jgi:hypothetical protein